MAALPPFEERLYEAIGTHFVDVFYNHVHAVAKKVADGGNAASVTDAYRSAVRDYLEKVKGHEFLYKRTVTKLQEYVQHYVQMSTNDYATFVDRTVATLIPSDYFADLTPRQKDELFSQMVVNLVSGLGVWCTRPENLELIIDRRQSHSEATIVKMQNYANALLQQEQGHLHNQFLQASSGAKGGESASLIANLKGALRELAEKTAGLEAELQNRDAELHRMKNKYAGLKAKHRGLVERLQALQAASAPLQPRAYPPPGAAPAAVMHPTQLSGPPHAMQPGGPPPGAFNGVEEPWNVLPPARPAAAAAPAASAGGFSVASRMRKKDEADGGEEEEEEDTDDSEEEMVGNKI